MTSAEVSNKKTSQQIHAYAALREISYHDFMDYAKNHSYVEISGKKFSLEVPEPDSLEPEKFEEEVSTVWSFPERGSWATHKNNASYRGNWAPQVARNLILKYSSEGDVVLDPFLGSGTSLIECVLLKRICLGVDINLESVMLSWSRLLPIYKRIGNAKVKIFWGDSESLDAIEDESVDFILGHPPYANIIRYSKKENNFGADDLSLKSITGYLEKMSLIAKELKRVVKPGGNIAIMIGDTRKKKHIVPLGYMVMQTFLQQGLILKEHIIKVQHNMTGTIKWRKRKNDFLLISHEHIFVFRKLKENEKFEDYMYSSYLALKLPLASSQP